MGGGASADDGDEIGGINVTPFVDIALVLLIVFMVTAKYIVAQSIPVDLPQAQTAQQTEVSTMVNVSVDRAQRLFVDARPIEDRELVPMLRARWETNHELRAVISADRTVPHGRVTQVIDLVRQANITRFAIQTDPGETTPDEAAAAP
jgi:biopolymer transport protein ExbD